MGIKLPAKMYHGTSRKAWLQTTYGDGPLYLTNDPKEARSYAYEMSAAEETEDPIVLEIPFTVLQSSDVALEPDWGGHQVDDSWTWEDTLKEFGSIAVSGDIESLKSKFQQVKGSSFKKGSFITIPLFLTEKPHTKTAISLPEIIRQTNSFSKKYRPGCVPTLLDSNPKALFLHYNVKCNKEESDPAGHDVRVQFDVTKVQETQQAKDLDIQVQCSCPAFLYWGAQWNLHQRDGLLGQPRPKLVAPTERLDLRANYVICKHVHAVFERILPSVQHNIVKILREREILKNKDKERQTPERLKKKQDEMRRKKEKEKILKIKDKAVREKMLDALRDEEQARRMHEQELMNQGKAPGEKPEPELSPEEEEVAKGPAAALPEEDEDLSAIQDLIQQEEQKVKELHKEHKPHVHKGLPYDIEPEEDEDKLMRKFESQRLSMLLKDAEPGMRVYIDTNSGGKLLGTVKRVSKLDGVLVGWDDKQAGNEGESWMNPVALRGAQQNLFANQGHTAASLDQLRPGVRVMQRPDMELKGTVRKVSPPAGYDQDIIGPQNGYVTVRWDNHTTTTVGNWTLAVDQPQLALFSAKKPSNRVTHENAKPGTRVHMVAQSSLLGTIVGVEGNGVRVKWDNGWDKIAPIGSLVLYLPEQRRMFAARLGQVQPGDTVWFDISPFSEGTVLEVRANKTDPPSSYVKVDWGELGTHEVMIKRLRTRQRSLF